MITRPCVTGHSLHVEHPGFGGPTHVRCTVEGCPIAITLTTSDVEALRTGREREQLVHRKIRTQERDWYIDHLES